MNRKPMRWRQCSFIKVGIKDMQQGERVVAGFQ